MIVELFGPPCAGKTTFARLLATGLSTYGLKARTAISARVSEQHGPTAARQHHRDRTARSDSADFDALNRTLLRLLPPRSPFWHLRLRRYLRVLAAAWARNEAESEVVIFDQGYMQALCSLVSLTREANPAAIRAAVALLPRPAARIHLVVPGDVLLSRLAERNEGLSLRERILELDTATILDQDRICGVLFERLGSDATVLRVTSVAAADLSPTFDAVAATLLPPTAEAGDFRKRFLREVGRS